MKWRQRRTATLAVLMLALAGCHDDEASVPAPEVATAPPTPETATAAPTTGASPATVPTTVATPSGVIDLGVAVAAPRLPTTVRAELGIGDGPTDLGLLSPNESAGQGPANPVLLTDGTVVIADGVNRRFIVVPADSTAPVTSPSPLVAADCASTGPDGVVYVADPAMWDGGISAFVVADGLVTRVAGPSGPGQAQSPQMGGPAEVPTIVDGMATAPGSQPLPLVGRDGALLPDATAAGRDTVRFGPAEADDTTTLVRLNPAGEVVGSWTVRLPTGDDLTTVPGLIWVTPLGLDGIAAAWDTSYEGDIVFAVARFDATGVVDAFTIPATWRLEGVECTNPSADESRLVALVPVEAGDLEARHTVGFRLLEWAWAA